MLLEGWKLDAAIRLGIATGFLGAYTTFSTLCKETAELIYRGDYFSAIIYIAISIVLGFAAVYFGIVSARKVVSKLIKKDKDELKDSEMEVEGGVE